jgi:hypothetical protein
MSTPASLVSSVGTLLSVLTACACEALREYGRPVCDCTLVHSAQVFTMDGCACSCDDTDSTGRLTGRILQIAPAPSTNTTVAGNCGKSVMSLVTVQLGVMRCITLTDDGSPAPDDIQTAEALGFLADEQILRAALNCCTDVNKLPGRWQLTPGQWEPHGPAGGCAGGVITVQAYGAVSYPKPVAVALVKEGV